MSDLLSQIYTAAGHHREAMRLHEDILRLVVEGDDGDDRTLDTMTPRMAKHQLSLLKAAYQRLGSWANHPSTYKKLVDQLLQMPAYKSDPLFKGVHSTDKWNPKDKPDPASEFTKPVDWEFVSPESLTDKDEVAKRVSKRPGWGFRRVTSNWGLNLVGDDDEDEEMPEKIYAGATAPDILVK
jgi:hypothetical protein